jgi:hypothetical protein
VVFRVQKEKPGSLEFRSRFIPPLGRNSAYRLQSMFVGYKTSKSQSSCHSRRNHGSPGHMLEVISFRAATNPELIELLSEAWPEVDMPTRKRLKSCLMKVAGHGKSNLKERLLLNKSKISIACDGWKSSNNISFIGMFLSESFIFPSLYRARHD